MLAGAWQNYKSETLNAEEAQKLLAKWQALSTHALESTGFNAPELVLPILKHASPVNLNVVQQGANLHFAMPFHESKFYNSSWAAFFSAAGAPHLVEGAKEATLAAFLTAQAKPFLFKALPSDGPFHNLLKARSHHYAVLESWSRACLRPTGTFENWLQNNFDQKRRKEFKRLRSRLSEQGNLQTEILSKADSADSFIEDFLILEASGWKGKSGTAIAADVNKSIALREALRNLHLVGKLRFWQLQLNGKSIASLFAIVEGTKAWLGKIAYDEKFAKYSPGALIILDCTESFFREPTITQIDSRAVQDHSLIDRIWRDRLSIISVFVAPETVSRTTFNFIVAIAKLKLKWRNRIRELYYQAKGKKRT